MSFLKNIQARKSVKYRVGFDLSAHHLGAVVLDSEGQIRQHALKRFPDHSSSVYERPELIEAFFKEFNLPNKVRIGLSDTNTLLRHFKVPKVDNSDDFDAAVRFLANDVFPLTVENAAFDYQIIGTDEQTGVEVIAVATPQNVIQEKLVLLEAAGIEDVEIDLLGCALGRVFTGTFSSDQTTALIHLGDNGNVAIYRDLNCRYIRVLPQSSLSVGELLFKEVNETFTYLQAASDLAVNDVLIIANTLHSEAANALADELISAGIKTQRGSYPFKIAATDDLLSEDLIAAYALASEEVKFETI